MAPNAIHIQPTANKLQELCLHDYTIRFDSVFFYAKGLIYLSAKSSRSGCNWTLKDAWNPHCSLQQAKQLYFLQMFSKLIHSRWHAKIKVLRHKFSLLEGQSQDIQSIREEKKGLPISPGGESRLCQRWEWVPSFVAQNNKQSKKNAKLGFLNSPSVSFILQFFTAEKFYMGVSLILFVRVFFF